MSTGTPGEWSSLRPIFVDQITQIAAEEGIRVTWYSQNWVAELRRGGKARYLIGYTFPLNDAASSRLADDKAAAATTLIANGVPAVRHGLIRFGAAMTMVEAARIAQELAPLPLVLKPNTEAGGLDVYCVRSPGELKQVMSRLARRYLAIAVAPLVTIEEEVRTVILDGQPFIVYRKVRSSRPDKNEPSEWRHNLRFGAIPELMPDGVARRQVTELAVRATDVLGLRFASVDVVLEAGRPAVLEVNSSVSLESFSSHSGQHARLAMQVYREAISRSLGP